jgi:peptide/nickel transport system permease protein
LLEPGVIVDAAESTSSATSTATSGAAASPDAPPRRRGRRHRYPLSLVLGGALVAVFVGVAFLSFFWTPYDPKAISVPDRLLSPGSPGYPFGTDKLGRDVVTQLMLGARNSLYVSVMSTTVALTVGALFGLLVAGAGPRWQGTLTRTADVGLALPGILVALVVATKLGPGNTTAILAIIVWFVPVAARVTIGPARQVLALDYVEAAYAYGRSRRFVLFKHVLPNIAPLLIVLASVMFAAAILIEAALAFLGVGVQPPTPSWGRFLNEAQPLLDAAPSLMYFPGLAIVLTVLGFNLLGDGLRTVLDPQQARTGIL